MIVEDQFDFPFIVLSPQCPSDEYWESQYDSLERLLDDIVDAYAVDTDRIYLTSQTGLVQCLHEAELVEPIHHGRQSPAKPDKPPAAKPEQKFGFLKSGL